jgi:predicted MPP superfamily phosphohydrolase
MKFLIQFASLKRTYKNLGWVYLLMSGIFIAQTSLSQTVTRGPYLQMGNQTSITIRWRTSVATNTKVTIGTVFGTYPTVFTNATSLTNHEISITGLSPDTKYYYTVGSTSAVLQGTATNFFTTLPPSNTTRKIKILALGDCGNNSTNQANVRDAFISYAAGKNINPDAWLLLGDNAYNGGLDAEYTTGFFNIYSGNLLKNIKLYPSPGNHDYDNLAANLQKRGVNLPYYNNFTMPIAAEMGGVASGTEAFYSYDIGDVHFVSLDSYGTEDGASNTKLYDTAIGNRQADWLRSDLAANTKTWTVVYFHHTPYTKGSHNSDTESDLQALHANIPAILERYGVDLVLNGHSHVYERSYLLKDLYANSNTYSPAINQVSSSTARYNGTANSCPYTYASGKLKHGTVYVVTGSAGQIGGSSAGWPLAFMCHNDNLAGGCFYFEVDSNRLDAKFISYTTGPLTPFVRDSFSIFKDVNKVQDIVVAQNAPLTLTASWRGTYLWPNNGSVTTQAVTLNNATTGAFDYIVTDANNCLKDSFRVLVTPPLPVLINSFTATLNKNVVMLDWSTAQEINSKYFTVERSADGNSFSFLGNVDASGNSTIQKNYHLVDISPVDGNNYYRLSQTDADGRRTSIGIKKVIYKSLKNFNATIVNMGAGLISIGIHNPGAGMIQLKVIDITGKDILHESFNSGSGDITHSVQLRKGIYVLLLVNSKGETISSKIISD